MHVPAAMEKVLQAFGACESCRGEVEACKQETASTTSSEVTEQHETPLLSTCYRKNQVVQRCALHLKDDAHRSWPVTYEVRVSSGQKHRRFTNGWAALCRGNGFNTGDKVAITITACGDCDGQVGVGSGRGVGILIRRVDQQDIPEE